MMPHGQKHEQGLKAPGETQGLGDEKVPEAKEVGSGETSSPTLIPGIPEEVPVGQIPSPVERSCSSSTPTHATLLCKSNEGSSGRSEEDPCTSQARPYSQFLLRTLMRKVTEVVKFLCVKYTTKEPVTKAEIMKKVIKEHKYYFTMIFKNVCECMEVVFGIEVKEVDATNHVYELIKILDLTYEGRLSEDQGIPKTGLLVLVLAVIFMKGKCAPEEMIWKVLRRMGIYPDKHEFICTNPRKLVTEEFVQEGYLEYRQVPHSDPPQLEFLWGPRAHAEISKMKVLKFYSRISGSSPTDCLDLYREALKDEEERAERAAAAGTDPAATASAGSGGKPGTE